MLVKQILGSKPSGRVLTIESRMAVQDAAEILSKNRVGALVIISRDGMPAGVISERDIVREIGRLGAAVLRSEVGSIMSSEVVTCTPGDTADHVLRTMTEGRFRHLPVIENNRMIGVISIGDVVKARLEELNLERDALEGMIAGY